MNEENQIQVVDYSKDIQEVKESNENINKSVQDLLNFFEIEKQEQQIKEEENKKIEEKQQKQLLEEQKKQEEELKKEKEQQQDFYSNIETISTNTNTEVTTELLTNVTTLMETSIMTNGLLIGIVCISLLAKFFKK